MDKFESGKDDYEENSLDTLQQISEYLGTLNIVACFASIRSGHLFLPLVHVPHLLDPTSIGLRGSGI